MQPYKLLNILLDFYVIRKMVGMLSKQKEAVFDHSYMCLVLLNRIQNVPKSGRQVAGQGRGHVKGQKGEAPFSPLTESEGS